VKTHAGDVSLNIGNIFEMYYEKIHLVIDDAKMEAMIHWNGPQCIKTNNLGFKFLDRHFGGRIIWNFIPLAKKSISTVINRLTNYKSKLPFL